MARLSLALGAAMFTLLAGFQSASQAANKGTAAVHGPIIQELHQTHLLLETANHDYDGFRAKAAGQVHKAIHALARNHKPHTATTTPHVPGNQPKIREPQAASDAQLRQAAKQLQVVMNQLASIPNDPHAATAVAHVRAALQDIDTALKIK